jgi:hypothetical protein
MSEPHIRVLDDDGRVVATYGVEWYSGHVKGVIDALGMDFVVEERDDDGSWHEVPIATVPYA